MPFAAFQTQVLYFGVHRGLIGWLLIGLLAGWLAGVLSRGRGFGCLVNIILGLIGAVLLVSIARLFAGSGGK